MSTHQHLTPPAAGMVLVAGLTLRSPDLAGAIGLEGTLVPRGTEIPIAALARCANSAAMLSSGMLAWRPPGAPRRPVPKAAPAPQPIAVKDYIAELRTELRALLPRCGSWATAEDVLVSTPSGADLFRRALAQFAAAPGGTYEHGAGRRPVNGFRAHVQQEAS
jgi:hypothetical protein